MKIWERGQARASAEPVAHWRLSEVAEADLADILAISRERWGIDGRRRYAALVVAALRMVAANPEGPGTRVRADLLAGLRSLHLRHARAAAPKPMAQRPVHVLYFRLDRPGLIGIVRVLHERMEPSRYVGAGPEDDV